MLNYTKEDLETIEKLRKLSGESVGNIKNILEAMFIMIVLDFVSQSKSVIPLIGKLNITHVKDILNSEGKKSLFSIIVEASSFFRKELGNIKDRNLTEIEKLLIDYKFSSKLNNIIDEV